MRVNAGDHIVESFEDFVGIIERAVGQDVAFGPLEQSEPTPELLVQCIDPGPLIAHLLDRQSAGHAERAGMIGDAQVRKSGRSGPVGHLLERRLTVAPIGMAMKGSREVLDRDQVGKGSLLGGFDLPRVLAQFGGDLRQSERLEQIGLGAASDLACRFRSEHTR